MASALSTRSLTTSRSNDTSVGTQPNLRYARRGEARRVDRRIGEPPKITGDGPKCEFVLLTP
jgi:hypothetical protein